VAAIRLAAARSGSANGRRHGSRFARSPTWTVAENGVGIVERIQFHGAIILPRELEVECRYLSVVGCPFLFRPLLEQLGRPLIALKARASSRLALHACPK